MSQIGGRLWFQDNDTLTALSMPDLVSLGELNLAANIALSHLALPSLTRISENVRIVHNSSLPHCLVESLINRVQSDFASKSTSLK